MVYNAEDPRGHYNTEIKVPEAVIQQIRDLGMEASVKLAESGQADPEFVEGVRRFYPFAFNDSNDPTQQPLIDPAGPPVDAPVGALEGPGNSPVQENAIAPPLFPPGGRFDSAPPVATGALERAIAPGNSPVQENVANVPPAPLPPSQPSRQEAFDIGVAGRMPPPNPNGGEGLNLGGPSPWLQEEGNMPIDRLQDFMSRVRRRQSNQGSHPQGGTHRGY